MKKSKLNIGPYLINVSAIVLDEFGAVVIGANVIDESNPDNGTSTDENGFFQLNDVDLVSNLVFSRVSIQTIIPVSQIGNTVNINTIIEGDEIIIGDNKKKNILGRIVVASLITIGVIVAFSESNPKKVTL